MRRISLGLAATAVALAASSVLAAAAVDARPPIVPQSAADSAGPHAGPVTDSNGASDTGGASSGPAAAETGHTETGPLPLAPGDVAPALPASAIQTLDPKDKALSKLPSDASALGGYDVLIADRGNNRILLVSPEKKILWEYKFKGLPPISGADDAFFADHGRSVITNLEHQQVIEMIDIATKKVIWKYGELGRKGSAPGLLNYPDDAYQLPNGNITVADIRNCRILEIDRKTKKIVRQAGVTGRCWGKLPNLASPNGDKPLKNGHLLVSTINDHSIVEFNQKWKPISKLILPIRYPSDPQMTKAGNYLVASYTKPGRIIEIAPSGKVLWRYEGKNEGGINKSSLAIELPNGNILATDDLNQRVIVIGKKSKKILWQFGVTGQPGTEPGYLSIPDGLDIIREAKQ